MSFISIFSDESITAESSLPERGRYKSLPDFTSKTIHLGNNWIDALSSASIISAEEINNQYSIFLRNGPKIQETLQERMLEEIKKIAESLNESLDLIRVTGSFSISSPIKIHAEPLFLDSFRALKFIDESISASKQPIPEIIDIKLTKIFSTADGEEFEYGYVSELSRSLDEFINIYGNLAIDAIQNCLPQKDFNTDMLIETLHTLGKSRNEPTHEKRLLLLLSALTIPSARIRCAASLALTYMDDPKAIPVLKKRLEIESHNTVKAWFQKTLDQLEKTQSKLQNP